MAPRAPSQYKDRLFQVWVPRDRLIFNMGIVLLYWGGPQDPHILVNYYLYNEIAGPTQDCNVLQWRFDLWYLYGTTQYFHHDLCCISSVLHVQGRAAAVGLWWAKGIADK